MEGLSNGGRFYLREDMVEPIRPEAETVIGWRKRKRDNPEHQGQQLCLWLLVLTWSMDRIAYTKCAPGDLTGADLEISAWESEV